MTDTVTVTSWRVYGWGRGRWTLRSVHFNADEAHEQAEFLCHRDRIRTRVDKVPRLVTVASQAPAPTAAKAFREAQADTVVLRRQAHAYFKSGLSAHPQLTKEEIA